MLTKAYIEDIVDAYSYKVRMIFYDGPSSSPSATSKELLYTAYVCCPPGVVPAYELGDVVYVDFEDDHVSTPVIMGQLYRANNSLSTSTINVKESIISDTCQLPNDTKIGSAKPEDLEAITEQSGNFQKQINIINDRISLLEST